MLREWQEDDPLVAMMTTAAVMRSKTCNADKVVHLVWQPDPILIEEGRGGSCPSLCFHSLTKI